MSSFDVLDTHYFCFAAMARSEWLFEQIFLDDRMIGKRRGAFRDFDMPFVILQI